MPRLSLLWGRCADGYELVAPPRGKTLAEGGGSVTAAEIAASLVVRRRSARLSFRQVRFCRTGAQPLYKRLANISPTPQGALSFIEAFGLLANRRSESVGDVLSHRAAIRMLLAAARRDDWETIELWLIDNGTVVRSRFAIGFADDGRPEVLHQPTTLISAIYLQLLQDKAAGTQYKRCKRPGCPEYFYYGPNTGRRETAEYCTPSCRTKHFLMKRSQANG